MNAPRNEELGLRSALRGVRVPVDVKRRIALRAMENFERPKSRATWPWVLAAGTAVAALMVGLLLPRAGTPAAGSLASTTGESTTYAIGPHRIALEPKSQLRFTSTDPAAVDLELIAGQAHFEVAHLEVQQTFRVRAQAALVNVVGTRFDVRQDGRCSQVRVREGRVRVSPFIEAPEFLVPGQERTYCRPADDSEARSREERLVQAALGLFSGEKDLPRVVELLEGYRAEYPSGIFEEEALFYLCLTQSRLGHAEEAQRLRELFASKFPHSNRTQRLRELAPERSTAPQP